MPTDTATMTVLAERMMALRDDPSIERSIRILASHPETCEMLRLIVRDDLAGASGLIVNALWDRL